MSKVTENACTQPNTNTSEPKTSGPRIQRFNSSLVILISLGLILILIQFFIIGSFSIFIYIFALFLCAWSHEWNGLHSSSLTRNRRACFDIANVLETYQPRARTMGHLFQPEPQTPATVTFTKDTLEHEATTEKSEFTNHRDSHYANMFQHAIQMNKEMELMEKAAAFPSLESVDTPISLTPANPSQDKVIHDEKKRKRKEEYKKQFEKPFSC